jgi:hypothetical protein
MRPYRVDLAPGRFVFGNLSDCNDDNNTCNCTQKLTATTGGLGSKKLPQAGTALKNRNTMKKY